MKLAFRPLDASTWKDFEELFGERGACGGCWCMSWKLPRAEFEKNKGVRNKNAMKQSAKKNKQLGITAYADEIGRAHV